MTISWEEFLNSFHLTPKSKQALTVARAEAQMLGSRVLGTEHLLLGLCADETSVAGVVLRQHGVRPDVVRGLVIKLVGLENSAKDEDRDAMRPSAALSRVLARSNDLAKLLFPLNGYLLQIGTEHLLMALFREPDSVAVRIMAELNVDSRAFFEDLQSLAHAHEFLKKPDVVFEKLRAPLEAETPETDGADRAAGAAGTAMPADMAMQAEMPTVRRGHALAQFGRDMTVAAMSGAYDPVVGRQDEMNRIMQILSRKTKNNPCLVGEPGVGKTAVVEGLAQAIASGKVPESMQGKHIIELDISSIVAGTRFRGEFEERMQYIIEEAILDRQVILFIDEIHTLIGGGAAEGSMDAANLLKPALSRGELRVIGATTLQEYRRYFERDAALARRFQSVLIREPSDGETVSILRGLRETYEKFHMVQIPDAVLQSAVSLSKRYIPDRCLPDKAIDLIDEAAAAKRLAASGDTQNAELEKLRNKRRQSYNSKVEAVRKGDRAEAARLQEEGDMLQTAIARSQALQTVRSLFPQKLDVHDLEQVVSAWTGIPVHRLGEEETERLLHLEETLHKRVIGQQEAVTALAKAVRRGRTGMQDPGRPVGSFIFLGPTGVGKTEVARALAEALFGSEKYMIRIDMSEYMEPHSVSRMVGSPPGYVGHEDGGQLTDKVRTNPYSVLLFDEIEKAHPDVFNILLQVLEDGQLTDTKGRTVDFKNTVIIMTSNIGARNITEPKRLGFVTETAENRVSQMQSAVTDELKKAFRPEFLNRIDEILVFRPLERDEIRQIAVLQLERVRARAKENGVELLYDSEVVEHLAEKGFDPIYGARPLKRLIRQEVEDLLAEQILVRGAGKSIRLRLVMREGTVQADGEE